ncbi:MAG TPA: NUDIX hydrolase [Bdellovibrionota bacterium]|nr:NUDIX hydrolase [Bdellovibrionota bacterium]
MQKQKVPYLTADAIIEYNGGIILIERKFPPLGWALPGGFVDYGEDVMSAAIREAKEETNLDMEDIGFFTLRADPRRDKRFHIITAVFAGKGRGVPKAEDDAKNIGVFKPNEIPKLVCDHNEIVCEFLRLRKV